jgi:hypothetical protein
MLQSAGYHEGKRTARSYCVSFTNPCAEAPCARSTPQVEAAECNDNLADCTERQLKVLSDWIAKFSSKYAVVGKVVP